MAECPKCGKNNAKPASEWVGGRATRSQMAVKRFVCISCGTSYVAWRDSKTGKMKSMTRKS
ncbi:MAG: hypothetical protein LYZ70_07800 [Nitrososphaerales archaeon]|nr:hypothetical protein [Nitrososphaerales archaeon]